MGIVNVTPDSFSDGGRHDSTDAAVMHGLELARQGADILDVGGESSRPGATPVSLEEEQRRVVPVVAELAKQVAIPISIDTYKAPVAQACIRAGAQIINDITALSGDPGMTAVAKASRAGVLIMHMQGTPQTMQGDPHYQDVIAEILGFFDLRLRQLQASSIALDALAIDPGIGFGKTTAHNLQLLANLAAFQRLGRPVCLGVSRKGFLGRMLKREVNERMPSSLAAVCFAQCNAAVQIVRVHDVAATRDAVTVIEQIQGAMGVA